MAPYTLDDLFLGSIINLQSRQMKVAEVPEFIKADTAKNCLIFAVDSYNDIMNVLTQTDKYKLTNLKVGSVDSEFITNLNVRDGQRVLAVEFTGTPDAGLAANPKCLANLDCYASGYDSHKLFNKGVIQQQLNKSVSLCVVKPHVLKSNILSKVIGEILSGGFEISSMELHNMNKLEVDEIFEV
jgi:hypothetical protein